MPIIPQKKLPNLDSLANPKAAIELINNFQRVYEYIDFVAQQLKNGLAEQIKSGQLSSTDLNSLIGVFSQPLAGSNVTDPLLQSIIQSFGSQLANLVFASPSGSAGNPAFRSLVSSDIPNLDTNKTTTGVFPLARLSEKLTKTEDNLTKNAGVFASDGYIELRDNNGHSVRILTTLG